MTNKNKTPEQDVKRCVARITRRQRLIAEHCLAHPDWTGADILRASGISEAVALHHAKRTLNAPGTQAAKAELLPSYREKLAERVSPERAAARLSQLVDSEDSGTALRALTTALEHLGIVERADQQRILIMVGQQYSETYYPLLRKYVPDDRWPDLLADLELIAAERGEAPPVRV